jgi:hypothetical protein
MGIVGNCAVIEFGICVGTGFLKPKLARIEMKTTETDPETSERIAVRCDIPFGSNGNFVWQERKNV